MLEPGIHLNIPFDEYLKDPAISNSLMKMGRKSMRHIKWAMDNPDRDDTPSGPQKIGSFLHCVFLEPDKLESRYATTSDGPWNKNPWKAEKDAIEERGLIPIKQADWSDALTLHDLCYEDEEFRAFMEAPGENEVTLIWIDPLTELRCKGRVDRLIQCENLTILLDFKSMTTANDFACSRADAEWDYPQQASHYERGANVLGLPDPLFVIAAIEKEPPGGLNLHHLPLQCRSIADMRNQEMLMRIRDCMASGKWPSYTSGLKEIDVPPWWYEKA